MIHPLLTIYIPFNFGELDCSQEEFMICFCCQVPHWFLLTNEGLNWAKGTEGIQYKTFWQIIEDAKS